MIRDERRIKRLEPWLRDESFMVTYGNGACNVDVQDRLRFHWSHGFIATVCTVRPPARFGGLIFEYLERRSEQK